MKRCTGPHNAISIYTHITELKLPYVIEIANKQKSQINSKIIKQGLTIVVGKEAAQTPSLLSVRSSTPDATTYN